MNGSVHSKHNTDKPDIHLAQEERIKTLTHKNCIEMQEEITKAKLLHIIRLNQAYNYIGGNLCQSGGAQAQQIRRRRR